MFAVPVEAKDSVEALNAWAGQHQPPYALLTDLDAFEGVLLVPGADINPEIVFLRDLLAFLRIQEVDDDAGFNAALATANPASTLVVVDATWWYHFKRY